RKSPRTAFRDFEAAARGGYAPAWFKLGRDYENFGDFVHARECFERGVKLGVESCCYVSPIFSFDRIIVLTDVGFSELGWHISWASSVSNPLLKPLSPSYTVPLLSPPSMSPNPPTSTRLSFS